ncbi:hypothetical protein GS18_0220125 [Metabacillus indicus]|uniref:N-acetyltransferase domain-containing protein n=2 Tax=Metabacillus indicus TaxID=246786 RepID=A0A084GIK2_METID|nr:hypothetical protein GS18_0220125 [Metabacillus indicus]
MQWVSIREVSEASINNFTCSDEERVEEFFKHNAKKYDFEMLARTHVLLDGEEVIVGFFTLFNEEVEVGVKKAEKLYSHLYRESFNLFPAVRLHYIGIDDLYRMKGIGREVFGRVFNTAIKIAEVTGCIFITAEAINDNIIIINEHYGFKTLRPRRIPSEPQFMALRIKDLLS